MSTHSPVTVLQQIADQVRARMNEAQALVPKAELAAQIDASRVPRDFEKIFTSPGYHVIAEVKLASPSEGVIAPDANPVAVAQDYLAHGAAALSVLTEQDSFRGQLQYLKDIRRAFPDAALLRKDFIVDEYQLLEARVAGADAVLLIVALLGGARTHELLEKARALGLSVLVEVHDAEEMHVALNIGASLIGVNNRNLKTLSISLETSEKLAALVARPGITLISESGLSRGADLKHLASLGYRGFLIGSHFMRTGTPGAALSKILKEASS